MSTRQKAFSCRIGILDRGGKRDTDLVLGGKVEGMGKERGGDVNWFFFLFGFRVRVWFFCLMFFLSGEKNRN